MLKALGVYIQMHRGHPCLRIRTQVAGWKGLIAPLERNFYLKKKNIKKNKNLKLFPHNNDKTKIICSPLITMSMTQSAVKPAWSVALYVTLMSLSTG
jgi:hypothetical protein